MGYRMAAAVAGIVLMATSARASDLIGTYTAEDDGERLTLELRVDGQGAVTGSLRSGGVTLSLQGRAEGATFEAACSMPGVQGPAMRLRGRLHGGAQLEVTMLDPSGQPLEDDEPLRFQRQGGARPGEVPRGTPPQGGNPLGGANPLAGGRPAPYAGTFQGDGLVLELQAKGDAYEGSLTFQGQRMACKASPVQGGGLTGSFATGQGEFAFEATDTPTGLRLTSGGQAYSLVRQGPAPAPANPLGGGPAGGDATGLPVEGKHALGVQFHMPEGWQALSGAQGVRLLPPGGRADDPNADEVHVLLAEVVQPQVTGPDHQDVATFLDQTMGQTFPLLRRQGGCSMLDTPAGKAGVYSWTGNAPNGTPCEGRAWVFIKEGKGAAYLSVATAAKLRERLPALQRIVGSTKSVKVEADGRVAGGYYCNGGWRSKDNKTSSDSHSTLTLGQDGRFQETWLSYVSTPAGIVENKEEKAGTYTAAGGVLTLRYQNGNVSSFRYALGQDGSLQCTTDDGGQTVWRRR